MSEDNWINIDIEAELKKLRAAHITADHIENMVADIQFHVFPNTTTTVCCLTLTNKFTVIGQSACVVTANFNAELGQKLAFEDAKHKIWQLEGYVLARIINNIAYEQNL